MREINLVKKKISNRPFHHTGEEIHFWSYSEEGSIENQFSASLTKEFERKLDNDISNFWFDIQSSVPENLQDNEGQVGSLKVKDNLGILKALREILVDEDSKKLYLVLVIKNGGDQKETIIERQEFLLEADTTLEEYEVQIDFMIKKEDSERWYEINLILDSIPVTFYQGSESTPVEEQEEPEKKKPISQTILENEILCDTIIITKEGFHVKCHKVFLVAHSSVFSDLLEKTNCVEMYGTSENGVRALLAYLYYWDTKEPENRLEVALELLICGYTYQIGILEKEMTKLILGRSIDWFDANVAVKLFGFARTTQTISGEDLKMKAVIVMNMKRSELKECPAYQELFKESPEIAMELCELAFQS